MLFQNLWRYRHLWILEAEIFSTSCPSWSALKACHWGDRLPNRWDQLHLPMFQTAQLLWMHSLNQGCTRNLNKVELIKTKPRRNCLEITFNLKVGRGCNFAGSIGSFALVCSSIFGEDLGEMKDRFTLRWQGHGHSSMITHWLTVVIPLDPWYRYSVNLLHTISMKCPRV